MACTVVDTLSFTLYACLTLNYPALCQWLLHFGSHSGCGTWWRKIPFLLMLTLLTLNIVTP